MRARASMVIYRCGVHGNAGSPPRSRAELTGLEGEHQTEEQQSLHGSAESVIGSELREDRMKKRDFSDSDSNLTHRRNPPPLSPLPGCARATLHHFTAFSLNLPLSLLPAPFSTTLWTGKHADTSATVPLWTFKIRADAEKNKKYLSSYSTTYNIFVLHCFSSYYIYIKMI